MKKVILILFVGVLGIFVGQQVQGTSTTVNDVLLENVEALADMENSGSDMSVMCLMSGESKCPDGGVKVMYVIEGLSLGEDEETY